MMSWNESGQRALAHHDWSARRRLIDQRMLSHTMSYSGLSGADFLADRPAS